MKKIIALTTLIAASSMAMAQGGFQDPNAPQQPQQMQRGFFDEANAIKNVKDAQNAKDDAPIMIEGKILKQVGKNDFIFQDATGQIQIDVSKKAWQGQEITPNDNIVIYGKVDKEWNKTELDVKRIQKK